MDEKLILGQYRTSGYSPHATSIGERAIKTLRLLANQLLRTGAVSGRNRGMRAVEKAAYVYNQQISGSVGVSPNDADKMENAGEVLRHVLARRRATDVPIRSPAFAAGQSVRLRIRKGDKFAKAGEYSDRL